MVDIKQIPQIPVFSLESLQNDLHIGFAGDLARRIDRARWADEGRTSNVFPPLVDTLMASFLSAQLDEDEAYSVSQASLLTARRLEKDRRRDALYRAIRRTVATFASLSIFPDRQAAALRRARRATDQAYRQLVLMLNSQAVVTSGDAASPSGDAAPSLHQRYVDLVRSIQETIRYYRQISDERRRQNRRPAPRTVG